MKTSKKKIFFCLLLLLLALTLVFKNKIACFIIKSNVEKKGGTINIEEFNLNPFLSSFYLKGEIKSQGKKVKLEEVKGAYHPFSVFKSKKHLSLFEINGGGITFEKKFHFEYLQSMPKIDLVVANNFKIEGQVVKGEENKNYQFLIEEMELRDWHKENGFVRFSFLHMFLVCNTIKITAESLDGQIVTVDSGHFSINLIREYLPAYISIVKDATISFHLTFQYPSDTTDGVIRFQIWTHEIILKEKQNLSLLEQLSFPMVQLAVKRLGNLDLKSEVLFSKQELIKDPSLIIKKCQEKLLKDIYSKILN